MDLELPELPLDREVDMLAQDITEPDGSTEITTATVSVPGHTQPRGLVTSSGSSCSGSGFAGFQDTVPGHKEVRGLVTSSGGSSSSFSFQDKVPGHKPRHLAGSSSSSSSFAGFRDEGSGGSSDNDLQPQGIPFEYEEIDVVVHAILERDRISEVTAAAEPVPDCGGPGVASPDSEPLDLTTDFTAESDCSSPGVASRGPMLSDMPSDFSQRLGVNPDYGRVTSPWSPDIGEESMEVPPEGMETDSSGGSSDIGVEPVDLPEPYMEIDMIVQAMRQEDGGTGVTTATVPVPVPRHGAAGGDMPFLCEECGKTFTTMYPLRRHQIVHSDERPFTCQYCHKGFKRKFDHNKHLRTHCPCHSIPGRHFKKHVNTHVCSEAFPSEKTGH